MAYEAPSHWGLRPSQVSNTIFWPQAMCRKKLDLWVASSNSILISTIGKLGCLKFGWHFYEVQIVSSRPLLSHPPEPDPI